jgi:hypothetical protein
MVKMLFFEAVYQALKLLYPRLLRGLSHHLDDERRAQLFLSWVLCRLACASTHPKQDLFLTLQPQNPKDPPIVVDAPMKVPVSHKSAGLSGTLEVTH